MPAFFNPRIFITKMTIEIRAGFRYNNSIPIHLFVVSHDKNLKSIYFYVK